MRTILGKILTVSSLSLLALASCKNNDPVISSSGTKVGSLQASTTSIALDRTRTNDPSAAVTFNFTATKYSYAAALLGTNLQIDSVGDNWKNPQVITLPAKSLSMSFSTIDFDNVLLKILPPDISSKVNVRVQYQLSAYVSDYSNVVSMDVTPYKATSWLYITGVFSGWANPGAAEDSLCSPTGNGIYSGIINFTNSAGPGDNEFLILPAKNWNHKYATNDPKGTTSSTETYDGANNFYAPPALGYYLVTIDINQGKISFQQANHYSVIGDAALGWASSGNDSDMKFINDANQNTWTLTLPLVSSGTFKVRENYDWTNSWGIPKPGTAGDGVANTLNSTSNNNITIPTSDTYTVTFNAPPQVYTAFTPTTMTTTTYSVTKQ